MSPSPKERLIAAVRAHQSGHLDITEAAYRDVLSADPDKPDATHYLGVLAYQQEELDTARTLVGRARELKPRDASIAANPGLVLRALGRHGEAEAEFEAALALEPRQPEAWFKLGLTRLHRQQFKPDQYHYALRPSGRRQLTAEPGVRGSLEREQQHGKTSPLPRDDVDGKPVRFRIPLA